jgi:hypothetical protein
MIQSHCPVQLKIRSKLNLHPIFNKSQGERRNKFGTFFTNIHTLNLLLERRNGRMCLKTLNVHFHVDKHFFEKEA